MLKVLFWVLVAIDAFALGIFALLGLAAAGPSRTNPIAALVIPFFIPGAILLGAILLFLGTRSTGARALAVLIAALPLLLVVGSQIKVLLQLAPFRDGSGGIHEFRSQALRDIDAAIRRDDVAAVKAAIPGADLNTTGLSGATVLVLALRHLRDAPNQLEVLRALLAAGADPNVSRVELPLQTAIGQSRTSGSEPVRLLLEAGANPNARSEWGDPVFFFGGGAGIAPGIMELLLQHGADVQLRDKQGRSAVLLPVNTGNWRVLELLLRRGAPWRDQRSANGEAFPEYVERMGRLEQSRGGSTNGLAEVLALLRAGAGNAAAPR